MPAQSVLLAGATGLVGRECLRLLLADSAFSRVVALVRRPIALEVQGSKLETHVVDFAQLEPHRALFAVDSVICALGTTIKQAGSQARFREVDYEYPLTLARLGLEAGARQYTLVSALGADARSRIFYNRVKGELEDAVRALGYRSVSIVRPSLLLGNRAELRMGEEVAKQVTRFLGPVIPASVRPVQARAVAETLVQATREAKPGIRIIESRHIHEGAAAP